MWRAFFLAIGISVFLLGAECLVVEQAVLHPSRRTAVAGEGTIREHAPGRTVIRPPEWVPWIFMSAGAVVVLYSFTIPRRAASG